MITNVTIDVRSRLKMVDAQDVCTGDVVIVEDCSLLVLSAIHVCSEGRTFLTGLSLGAKAATADYGDGGEATQYDMSVNLGKPKVVEMDCTTHVPIRGTTTNVKLDYAPSYVVN